MYVQTKLGYVSTCKVKEGKKCSFENALLEKSESSTRNKNGLVEGLQLLSILGKSIIFINCSTVIMSRLLIVLYLTLKV